MSYINTPTIQWLLENSGSAIKLRLIKEGLISRDAYNINDLADEILTNEKINHAMSYFDKFIDFTAKLGDTPYRQYFRQIRDPVHGCFEDCLEMYMPFFTKLGFMKGINIFDEKTAYLPEVYKTLNKQDAQNKHSPFLGTIISTLLLRAGYYYDDIDEFMVKRLNAVHKVTGINSFDFYETDIEKIRNPKRWGSYRILKDIHNPYTSLEYPLPLSVDAELFFIIQQHIDDEEINRKIENLAHFFLNPSYQKLGGDYGWGWSFAEKTYHAMNSGVRLPLYSGDELDRDEWFFLTALEAMSYSQVMIKSEWFMKCMNYLEQYKTEKDTYLFPNEFFTHLTYHTPAGINVLCDVFISKEIMPTLKKNQRKLFAYEIYSTFFMIMLKNRMV